MRFFLIKIAAFVAICIPFGYAQTVSPVTKDEAATYQALLIFYFLPDDFGAEFNKELIPKPENKVNRTAKLIEQAQNGSRVLQAILGFAYESGLDKKLSQNIDKAEYWYKKSAELGFEPSYLHLAELSYCQKPKTTKNQAIIQDYLKKAKDFPPAILMYTDYKINEKNISLLEISRMKDSLLKIKLNSNNPNYFWGMAAELQSPDVDITLARIYNKLGDNVTAGILLNSALDVKTASFSIDVSTTKSTIERYQYLIRAIRSVQNNKPIANPLKPMYCD